MRIFLISHLFVQAIQLRTGIVGIERSIQEKQKATDQSISAAFQDLSKLMSMAKDMVHISKSISEKIRVIFYCLQSQKSLQIQNLFSNYSSSFTLTYLLPLPFVRKLGLSHNNTVAPSFSVHYILLFKSDFCISLWT